MLDMKKIRQNVEVVQKKLKHVVWTRKFYYAFWL